jgi:hypothetical protein
MWWKDSHDELSKCKTRKKKQAKQIHEHKEIIKRVGVYISLQMQKYQDRDVIWAPYHFQ